MSSEALPQTPPHFPAARKLLPDEAVQLWAKGHFSGPRWLMEWTANELSKLLRREVASVAFSDVSARLIEDGWHESLVADMGRFFEASLIGAVLQSADRARSAQAFYPSS